VQSQQQINIEKKVNGSERDEAGGPNNLESNNTTIFFLICDVLVFESNPTHKKKNISCFLSKFFILVSLFFVSRFLFFFI